MRMASRTLSSVDTAQSSTSILALVISRIVCNVLQVKVTLLNLTTNLIFIMNLPRITTSPFTTSLLLITTQRPIMNQLPIMNPLTCM